MKTGRGLIRSTESFGSQSFYSSKDGNKNKFVFQTENNFMKNWRIKINFSKDLSVSKALLVNLYESLQKLNKLKTIREFFSKHY